MSDLTQCERREAELFDLTGCGSSHACAKGVALHKPTLLLIFIVTDRREQRVVMPADRCREADFEIVMSANPGILG